ncbi:MAG TPA: M15 family metallopeptidase, partial [Mycobacteriales bacterium]|nr:M15 family metallopeptidase [Mycobacteriales bacterium]
TVHTFSGCYVPRFMERDPSHPVSLHTWGIAIDIDAPHNARGTRGTIDPRVVAIFKRWGFRWGGDWDWTDPMHFELGALLRSR